MKKLFIILLIITIIPVFYTIYNSFVFINDYFFLEMFMANDHLERKLSSKVTLIGINGFYYMCDKSGFNLVHNSDIKLIAYDKVNDFIIIFKYQKINLEEEGIISGEFHFAVINLSSLKVTHISENKVKSDYDYLEDVSTFIMKSPQKQPSSATSIRSSKKNH